MESDKAVLCEDDSSTVFFETLQSAREAVKVLNDLPRGDLGEYLAETSLNPDILAQILMEHLPIDGMGFANKEFWFYVGQYMGPDWIESFRKVGAFMHKVNEF